MPSLLMLIGLPGSGKSTLARHLAAQGKGWVLVSTDAIRAQLFGDEAIQGPWLAVQSEVERSLRLAAQQAEAGLVEGAIYDATNAVRKHRRAAIALIRQCGFTTITGLWLDVPLEVCLQRNQARDRQVPPEVILRMHRRLMGAPPSLMEGLDRLERFEGFDRFA